MKKYEDIPWMGRAFYWLTHKVSIIFPSYAHALRWGAEIDRQITGPLPLRKKAALESGSTRASIACDEVTPCCGKRITPPDGYNRGNPCICWNPFNYVVQCHHCGQIYVPGDEDAIELWPKASEEFGAVT